MQPGDEVILPYQEYSQLKKAFKDNPALAEENKHFKKVNEELSHKFQVSQQKLVIKNALLCKEQFKVEYLMSLFDDLNKAFGIKAQDIGKGMKFLRNMDETYFSVIKLPGEVDEDQRLPDNFSKSNTFIEVDTQLHAYKSLSQVCTKQWEQKLKLVEYLEESVKTSENKDVKKIQQQGQKIVKELRGQVDKLEKMVKDLQDEIENQKGQISLLICKNERLVQSVVDLQTISKNRLCQVDQLMSQKTQLSEKLHEKSQALNQQQTKLKNLQDSMKSNNLQVETHLEEQIKLLNEEKNLLKQKLIEIKQIQQNGRRKINEMKTNEQKLIEKVDVLTGNEKKLNDQVRLLHSQIDQLRRFAQISTEKVQTLKNQVEKLQKQILQIRTQVSISSTNDHVTDIKSKLFSLISEYIIYLNKSMMEINLTTAEKKTIIRSEVLEVEEQFGKQLKKLKL